MLTKAEKHQLAVAKKTIASPDEVAELLAATTNSPTKQEAVKIIKRLEAKK